MKTYQPSMPPRGFSLIELMVAVVIGMVTVLVATNVLINSMQQKRASVSGSDAMVNGTLGLYTLERDIKNAGFGLNQVASSTGCEVRRQYAGQPMETLPLVPVSIIDGDDGAPDEIRILASNKPNAILPMFITGRPSASDNDFLVGYALGVDPGDFMIAVPATPQRDGAGNWTAWCTVFQVTAVNDLGADGTQIVLADTSPWNHDGDLFPSGPGLDYWMGDYLLNLGNPVVEHTYDIDPDNFNALRLARYQYGLELNRNPRLPLYPNIVQLQAVYGKDTDNDGAVNDWNADRPTTPAEWQEVIAARVALVARSDSRESADVTPADDTCATASAAGQTPPATAVCWRPDPTGGFVDIAVDSVPDWQRYRYRVLETTIPLRNAIWARP